MRVQFPIVKQEVQDGEETHLIVYPDDVSLFSNIEIIGNLVVADYTGNMNIAEYVEVNIAPVQLSKLAFINLVGDANITLLQDLAEYTNPDYDSTIRLFLRKLDLAEIIDFDDLERGPKDGLAYCLAKSYITEEDYDRILRREFP